MNPLYDLFVDQRRYLNTFFEEIDLAQAEAVFDKILSCKGVVVLTGVGKSGHIAEKIAATFVSTGTRAVFLSPGHALHGDLGFLSDADLLILISKSGESQELLDLLPYAQKKGTGTIAVISQSNSRLAKASDLSVLLPVVRELCPYDLAPTTSTAVQLIFGDCLAIALMKARQFTVKDFALNHPAGFLGRKITLKVADLMLKGEALPLCRPTDLLIERLHDLSHKKCGCLLAVDAEGKLLGILTDGDLRRAIQTQGPEALNQPLSNWMTQSPKWIDSDALVWEAMKTMEEDLSRLITVLPVIDNGQVTGLLRMHDILQAKLKS